jgi:hypothetical protein
MPGPDRSDAPMAVDPMIRRAQFGYVAAPASLLAFAAWQFRERCAGQRRVQLGAPSKRPDSIRMRKPVVTSVATNGPAICRPGPGAWQVPRAGDLEHHPQSLVPLSLS